MSCVIKPSAWNWDGEQGAKTSSAVFFTFPRTSNIHPIVTATFTGLKLSTPPEMPPLPAARRNLLRLCPRQHLPPTVTPSVLVTTQQRRCKADALERQAGEFDQTPKFQSPFKNRNDNPTTKIPNFAHYMSKRGGTTNKTFQYFMVGGMGLLTAAGAKATVQGESSHLVGEGGLGRCYGV